MKENDRDCIAWETNIASNDVTVSNRNPIQSSHSEYIRNYMVNMNTGIEVGYNITPEKQYKSSNSI